MTNGTPKKVLIIDDERPILMTLEALLTRHHYRVEAARTAARAWNSPPANPTAPT